MASVGAAKPVLCVGSLTVGGSPTEALLYITSLTLEQDHQTHTILVAILNQLVSSVDGRWLGQLSPILSSRRLQACFSQFSSFERFSRGARENTSYKPSSSTLS